MDGTLSLQELLLTLEMENRARIAHDRASLLHSSQNAFVSQQPVTSVNGILSRVSADPSMSVAATSKAPSSLPHEIVSKGGTSPKFPSSMATGLPASGAAGLTPGFLHSSAGVTPAGGGIQGVNDPGLSRIIDGLILKRQIMLLNKLARSGVHSSAEPQVHQISSVPAQMSSMIAYGGESMTRNNGAIPSIATTKNPDLSQLVEKLVKEEQETVALCMALKTLQGHSSPGLQVPQASSKRSLAIPVLSPRTGSMDTTREAILDSLLSQIVNRSSDEQKNQTAAFQTPRLHQGQPLLGNLQDIKGSNSQAPVSSLISQTPRASAASSPRSLVPLPPANNMDGRPPFCIPSAGQEDPGRITEAFAEMDYSGVTSLLCKKQNSPALDSSVTPTTSFEGDPIIPVSLDSENCTTMPEYQCLFRQQLVFIETNHSRNNGKAQGRSKPISKGQVGILCRYCASLPLMNRAPGAVYYPAKLDRIYQAAVNMGTNHFERRCSAIPEQVRQKLRKLKEQKTTAIGAGKGYWADAARQLGVREGEDGLFLDKQLHQNNKKRAIEEVLQLCQTARPQKATRYDSSS